LRAYPGLTSLDSPLLQVNPTTGKMHVRAKMLWSAYARLGPLKTLCVSRPHKQQEFRGRKSAMEWAAAVYPGRSLLAEVLKILEQDYLHLPVCWLPSPHPQNLPRRQRLPKRLHPTWPRCQRAARQCPAHKLCASSHGPGGGSGLGLQLLSPSQKRGREGGGAMRGGGEAGEGGKGKQRRRRD